MKRIEGLNIELILAISVAFALSVYGLSSSITGYQTLDVGSEAEGNITETIEVQIEESLGNETFMIPNTTENETSQSNETSLENATDTFNETQEINVTEQSVYNQTQDTNISDYVENATSNETQSNVSDSAENEILTEENTTQETEETQGTAVLDVSLEYQNSITRGEPLTIRATVTNQGDADASNVMLEWSIPAGFEVVSEGVDCGTIVPKGSCARDLVLNTDAKTPTGVSKIKVMVKYA